MNIGIISTFDKCAGITLAFRHVSSLLLTFDIKLPILLSRFDSNATRTP
jgi:hypothetical protein